MFVANEDIDPLKAKNSSLIDSYHHFCSVSANSYDGFLLETHPLGLHDGGPCLHGCQGR